MAPITIDPALFTEDAIAPETRATNERVEAILKEQPTIIELGPETVRATRGDGQGLLGKQPAHEMARWETASALGLDVPVRVFRPDGALRGVYLHIHGGGHVIGTADSQDQGLAMMAQGLRIGVVSVEYRLAPENRWPAPADDCEAAALWLAQGAAADLFGTDRLLIGGESAGAHLSAVTLLRLKHRHGLTPFSGANLVYGVYDMALTPSAKRWGDRNLIISGPIMAWFGEQLLPAAQFSQMDKRDPDLSPLYADVSGLCPALFTCGTLDPLIDDTLFMASRWTTAGNEAELAIYPGGIHAFNALPDLPIATAANLKMAQWLAEKLE
ncbi:alpha/beta hydrolase [Parvularcula dongshanensis]|uniref:Acetyl esterase/lipase n=1 Tax=Parvularcula dongshanensis TaxID=1173995 RepID=A0A840I3C7_9PROT|nr:alpha/beta hydrolase [Parvularcula dongshanensis]MBB4658802.1 acetyl esterase/lipase [Parvularcula dongshanensis]